MIQVKMVHPGGTAPQGHGCRGVAGGEGEEGAAEFESYGNFGGDGAREGSAEGGGAGVASVGFAAGAVEFLVDAEGAGGGTHNEAERVAGGFGEVTGQGV